MRSMRLSILDEEHADLLTVLFEGEGYVVQGYSLDHLIQLNHESALQATWACQEYVLLRLENLCNLKRLFSEVRQEQCYGKACPVMTLQLLRSDVACQAGP